jgi:chitodextrinase
VYSPKVRVAEYSGIDAASPLDGAIGATGNSAGPADSGVVATTNASDLLVAGTIQDTSTTGAGTGYTSRISGNLLEDRIVTSTGSYNATAPLTASGAWIIQLAAFKAASGGGGDTVAPSMPSGLSATAASSAQINLSWTASTDNVGVTGYLLERCSGANCTTFAQIATPTATTYSDTGLSASTSYRYRVRARDAVPNYSGYSSTASATTQAGADTVAPSAPAGLTATPASSTQINLSWTASTDNVSVTGYLVERCAGASCTTFAQIATPTTTAYSDTGLSASTSYSYRVRARDAVPNYSGYSNTASATTQNPPTAPTGLSVTAASATEIDISWSASSGGAGVTGYLIERCQGASCSSFTQVGTPGTTTFFDGGLTAATSYSYRARAIDSASNVSSYSTVLTTSTLSVATCD